MCVAHAYAKIRECSGKNRVALKYSMFLVVAGEIGKNLLVPSVTCNTKLILNLDALAKLSWIIEFCDSFCILNPVNCLNKMPRGKKRAASSR